MIRVLICERSGFIRFVLSDIISAETRYEVTDPAAGLSDLEMKIKSLQPDILLIGAEFLKKYSGEIKKGYLKNLQLPLLVVLEERVQELLNLLDTGTSLIAETYVIPKNYLVEQRAMFYDQLLDKIKNLNRRGKVLHTPAYSDKVTLLVKNRKRNQGIHKPESLLVIGASTGGTQAIESIVSELNLSKCSTLLIAVHLPSNFTKTFTKRLNEFTGLEVVEGRDGILLEAGKIFVAPGDKNMEVTHVMGSFDNLILRVTKDETGINYDQPSIDKLMLSAVKYTKNRTLGVILTGMGADGALGASAIFNAGGTMVAQDQDSSVIFGMARVAIASGSITKVLPLNEIAGYINSFSNLNQTPVPEKENNATDEIERTGI